MIKTLLLASTLVASAADPFEGEAHPDTRLYELRTYHANEGKLDGLLARFRDHTMKLFEKHGMTNVAYWVPSENPDNLLIYLMAYPDRASRDSSWKAFLADPEWKKAAAESEQDGKLVAKVDSVYMQPTDFSSSHTDLFAGEVFEMRTYIATPRNLPGLQSRFRDDTTRIFAKHGMNNHWYFELTPDQPGSDNTLIYFLSHKDAESAKQSWQNFASDPDWVAAKKASEEKAGGSLTEKGGVKSVFLKATDFSPVK